jgi:hypothetical protein
MKFSGAMQSNNMLHDVIKYLREPLYRNSIAMMLNRSVLRSPVLQSGGADDAMEAAWDQLSDKAAGINTRRRGWVLDAGLVW